MKKVLFISDNNALRVSYGAEQRGNVILNALLQNDCYVDFAYIGPAIETFQPAIEKVRIVYWNDGKEWSITQMAAGLRLLTIKIFPVSSLLSKIIDEIVRNNNYDFIFCRYLQFASLAGLERYSKKLILDIDDVPAQTFRTRLGASSFPKSIYHWLMYKGMERETRRWIKRCHVSLFPNEEQARNYGGTFLPNIPVVSCSAPLVSYKTNNILFIGRMDFAPNYCGMDAFIKYCWDRIVEIVPDAMLYIAGKGLCDDYKQLWESHKNVIILGYVDSLLSFYEEGNIVIVPITSGSGTNIKVIEALSLGKACVISKFSTRGFEDIIRDGENCKVYDSFEECQDELIKLLNSPEKCELYGNNAYYSVTEKYSQQAVNSIVKSFI